MYVQNKYVIVFEDLFSRYVELKPLRKADAKSVLKAFDELIINRWGCPHVLLMDNGIEFADKMVTDRLTEYGIVQSTIPPYHAQANPVERVNRNLRAMINSFLKEDHRDWDFHLVELGFALNTAVHSSLGVSPSFMNFGRNPTPSILFRSHLENPQPILPRTWKSGKLEEVEYQHCMTWFDANWIKLQLHRLSTIIGNAEKYTIK